MKMIGNQEGNVLLLFLIGIFIFVFLVIEIMYQDLLWMENQISLENEEYLNNLLESGYALAVVELYQIDRETINDIEVKTIHYDNITYKLEYISSTT